MKKQFKFSKPIEKSKDLKEEPVTIETEIPKLIKTIRDYYTPYIGMPGYNPYFQLLTLDKLEVRFKLGYYSRELYELLVKFPLIEPKA